MRWIKSTLLVLGGFVVLFMVLIAIVLVIFDNDDYRRLVTRSVKFLTGYSVAIEGPFALELSAEPSLSAEAIRFDPGADGSPPPVTTIGKLRIQIALSPLLKGVLVIRQLLAEDVVMAVTIEEEAETKDRRASTGQAAPDIEIPILESVRLRNIHLDVIDAAAKRTVKIRLRNFDIDDIRDTGPLFVNGEGAVSGNDFKIDGRLGALSAMLKGAEPYPVALDLTSSGFELSVFGTVEDVVDGKGLKLRLSGEAGELSNLFKLLQIEVPPLGHLKLEGAIAHDISAPRVSYLDVTLSGGSQVEFAVYGSIANAISGEGANIQFSGSCENPDIFKMLLPEDLPALSRIRLAGKLHEAQGEIAVENLTVDAVAEQGLSVTADGRIGLGDNFSEPAINAVDVNIKLSAPTMGAAFVPLGVTDMPHLKQFRATAQVGGTTEALSLEKIALSIGQSSPLRMEVKGEVGRIPLAGDRPISDVKLSASFQAANTSALSTVLGVSIPDFGPLKATGRIIDRKGTIGVRDVNVLVGDAKNAALKVTGTIASVLKDYDVAVDGIDLVVEAHDLGLQSFSDLIGQPLPDVGPLKGSFQLAGSPAQLAVSNAMLSTVSSQGLTLTGTGGVDRIRLDGEKLLEGVDVSLSATAPDSGALAALADLELPDLGPVQMKAIVNDRSGSLDVEAFNIRCGSGKKALFHLQGQILRITDLKQMALQAAFETASHPWVEKYMQQPQADNFPLAGAIKLSGAADGLIINGIRFGTADGKRLVLEAQGRLTHLSASPGIDLQLTASAPDPPAVGSMVGVSLPQLDSLAISGRLNGNAQKVVFEGETRIGETTFTSKVSGAFAAERPRIDARFAATSVNLENMGINPETPVDDSVQTREPKSSKGGRLFDDTPLSFETLRALDLYLALDADKVIGRNVTIEKLDLDILLENGRLRIHPASMLYAAGFTSSEFVIDASGSTPEFILKVTGEDIDVNDMLAYAHEPIILSGSVNLVIDLQSSGRSPREIASNLKGEFGIALENGRIRRIIDFLSLDAFDMVLTTADRRKYTDLHCLINKMQFQDGVGNIEIFFMDSPKVRAKGAGKVNLAEETIDVVIHPEKKRKLFKKGSAVRINGPLAKPSVMGMPLSEAALLYGEIFMPYVFIPARGLGYLWSLIKNDKEATPCVFEKR